MYICLLIAGWFSICGATYNFKIDELLAPGSRPVMQAIWIGLGLLIAFGVLMVNSDIFETGAPLFYALMLLLCMVTIAVAPDIKGSRSWLVIGPLRLQPAEFTKVATALTLAWQCSKYGFEIKSVRSYLIVMAIIYFISALIFDEVIWFGKTDAALFLLSNMIMLFSLIMLAVYGRRQERNTMFIGLGLLVFQLILWIINTYWVSFNLAWVALALLILLACYYIYLWAGEAMYEYLFIGVFALGSLGFFFSTNYVFDNILQPHQQVRIKLSLGIEEDVRGKGYNVDQSKIAIGSGGLWGKGFLEGTQTKLNYVPEQDTDFIFCTVGEEQGFLGSSLLIIGYSIFILRLCSLAERQTTKFGRVYGYSVAVIFLFHLSINVGMVMGLVPVIGIPLPFFSYGGSSLWGFSFMLFIFLGIDARRNNKHL